MLSKDAAGPLLAATPGLALLVLLVMTGKLSPLAAVLLAAALIGGVLWAARRMPPRVEAPAPSVDTTIAAAVLDALPNAVLLLDGKRRVVAANRAAVDLLGEQVRGRDLSLSLRHPDALAAVNAVLEGRAAEETTEILMPAPVRRTFEVQVASLGRADISAAKTVVALHDVSAIRSAEQIRTDFVANVGHELRSPLTTLTGMIETLQKTARDDPEARERFLGIMETESRRMALLVDDLLSLSRVEADEHIQPRDRVELAPLLGEVVESLAPRARERDMALELDCPDGLPAVAGDRRQLVQIFHNLIDNAVKYGRAGTPVRVTARAVTRIPDIGAPGVSVAVADEGEGIAAEHLPRLTERFYRVDKGRSRSMGGTGLGLAIVKHIVNRHRGRLSVDSTPGRGSVFTVSLLSEPERAAGTAPAAPPS